MSEIKKLYIGLGIILCVGLVSFALVLLLNHNSDNQNVNENNLNNNVKYDNFSLLQESDIAFTLQKIINNYYELLINNKKEEVIKILDSNYQKNDLNSNYNNVQYIPEKIYNYSVNNLEYYIIEGYLIDRPVLDGKPTYNKDINYFATLDYSNKKVSLYPLENIDIEDFIKSYNFKDKKDLSYTFLNVTISEKNKLKIYINNFLNLLYYDVDKAYSMLGDKTKKYYGTKNDFKSNIDYIYNNIKSSVFSFFEYQTQNEITYNIKDDNQNSITIHEMGAMYYSIDFSINSDN